MTSPDRSTLHIRPAGDADAAQLCELLNQIIAVGGTTAYQEALTVEEFAAKFLHWPDKICCFAAALPDGALQGFQYMGHNPNLPDDWGDIATFARLDGPVRGVGTALFAATKEAAQRAGLAAINATIRADNVPGLAFYGKMGFADYAKAEAVPLADGTPVDRISRKYVLK